YNELVQKRVELNQLINQGELSTEEQARAEKNLSIVIQSINRARQDSVRLNNEEIKALITKVQIAERYRDVQEADLDRDELLHIEEGKDALELLIQRRQELNRLIQSGNLSARDQVEAEQQLNTILQA